MDPSDRNLVLAALETAKTPPNTVSDLIKDLVKEGIFTQAVASQHSKEILSIWRDWRQRSAPSPPDSNIGGKQDEADSNSPTGKLALYGPVDDQVALDGITLFRPRHGTFCFAHSRRSERPVSFIQEDTVKLHKLESEDDGTVIIQWRYAGRATEDFEGPNDQRVHHTCCVVLSADDVKEVGMTVEVVFGTSYAADLDQQRGHIPPPRCPTPPDAPSSDMDQMDGPAISSFGDAEGAAQQLVPIAHPGSYQPTRPSHAEPSPFVQNANQVYIFNNVVDPVAFVQQIGSSIGNRGVPASARTAASSMSEAQAVASASKRKADGDTHGFDRAKRFQC